MAKDADQSPVTRVEISSGSRQVVVEAAVPLATAKRAALDLFERTDTAPPLLAGGVGFGADLADRVLPPELDMPGVSPAVPDDRRRPVRPIGGI